MITIIDYHFFLHLSRGILVFLKKYFYFFSNIQLLFTKKIFATKNDGIYKKTSEKRTCLFACFLFLRTKLRIAIFLVCFFQQADKIDYLNILTTTYAPTPIAATNKVQKKERAKLRPLQFLSSIACAKRKI